MTETLADDLQLFKSGEKQEAAATQLCKAGELKMGESRFTA